MDDDEDEFMDIDIIGISDNDEPAVTLSAAPSQPPLKQKKERRKPSQVKQPKQPKKPKEPKPPKEPKETALKKPTGKKKTNKNEDSNIAIVKNSDGNTAKSTDDEALTLNQQPIMTLSPTPSTTTATSISTLSKPSMPSPTSGNVVAERVARQLQDLLHRERLLMRKIEELKEDIRVLDGLRVSSSGAATAMPALESQDTIANTNVTDDISNAVQSTEHLASVSTGEVPAVTTPPSIQNDEHPALLDDFANGLGLEDVQGFIPRLSIRRHSNRPAMAAGFSRANSWGRNRLRSAFGFSN
ncbi:hypothetical protein HDU76_012948 [Blyttiomyces sp. JEL0837]|nr:hypothetical protein HDU76_012948 [Blyttiomyces sp. JEL0837]